MPSPLFFKVLFTVYFLVFLVVAVVGCRKEWMSYDRQQWWKLFRTILWFIGRKYVRIATYPVYILPYLYLRWLDLQFRKSDIWGGICFMYSGLAIYFGVSFGLYYLGITCHPFPYDMEWEDWLPPKDKK